MIPILHYPLHQWSQFYIISMIPILHYINDPNCTLHQWSQFYITSMILISSNNVSFYIRSKWTLRLPLCLTSLAVISWWSALLAGKNHSNHWRLQGTSHNRCKFSHHTINPSNMQIKWKKTKQYHIFGTVSKLIIENSRKKRQFRHHTYTWPLTNILLLEG